MNKSSNSNDDDGDDEKRGWPFQNLMLLTLIWFISCKKKQPFFPTNKKTSAPQQSRIKYHKNFQVEPPTAQAKNKIYFSRWIFDLTEFRWTVFFSSFIPYSFEISKAYFLSANSSTFLKWKIWNAVNWNEMIRALNGGCFFVKVIRLILQLLHFI